MVKKNKSIRSIKDFIKFIDGIGDNEAWDVMTVFGKDIEVKMNKKLSGEKKYSEVARILKDDLGFTEFQVGFAIGVSFMAQNQEAIKLMNVGMGQFGG